MRRGWSPSLSVCGEEGATTLPLLTHSILPDTPIALPLPCLTTIKASSCPCPRHAPTTPPPGHTLAPAVTSVQAPLTSMQSVHFFCPKRRPALNISCLIGIQLFPWAGITERITLGNVCKKTEIIFNKCVCDLIKCVITNATKLSAALHSVHFKSSLESLLDAALHSHPLWNATRTRKQIKSVLFALIMT